MTEAESIAAIRDWVDKTKRDARIFDVMSNYQTTEIERRRVKSKAGSFLSLAIEVERLLPRPATLEHPELERKLAE